MPRTMHRPALARVVFPALLGLVSCRSAEPDMSRAREIVIAPDVEARLARFAPVEIRADLSELSPADRAVLDELIAASRPMGEIFLRQAWQQNPALRAALARLDDPRREAALAYFDVMAGPWDRLDETDFLGAGERPPGAGFYPPDLTRAEFEGWVRGHPGDAAALQGLYHVVVRRPDGGLEAVPYHRVYARWLRPAAEHLRRAAELTGNASLARFLRSRAAAFASDDYYRSDMDWMDLDSAIEVTIGPYEVYEDRLFGYKASFEAFVTVVSEELSRKLSVFKAELPGMEMHLPIPDELKNRDRGTESPIRVADLVFSAGDTRAGVQTIAFNLPNDERVREAKGSKKVLLRNVMNAKFEKIMAPLARRVLAPEHHGDLSAEAFFHETLFHELSHGLGPGKIVVGGRPTEVRKELREIYSTCEECKADVMGAYQCLFMIDRGHLPAAFRRPFLVTYFAGLFRSVRFGVAEAHGRGAAAQIHWYLERGGARYDPATRTFTVDPERLEQLVGELTRELCVLQAHGDRAGTVAFFDRHGVLGPELEAVLERLGDLPVDIRPIYVDAGERRDGLH